MKAVTAAEMREIDRATIEEEGIPAEVLMGNAGKAVAGYIASHHDAAARVAVFSGTGNNGGDGFAAALSLAKSGIKADLYLAGEREKVSPVSRIYMELCAKKRLNITQLKNREELDALDLGRHDLILDCLLGTGFQGTPRGIVRDAIEKINSSGVKVISVDVPSGLSSDGEAPGDAVVKADATVTIGLPKISLVTCPGKEFAGRLHVADIGFPRRFTESEKLKTEMMDREYVRRTGFRLGKDPDTYKGAEGHLLLVGGFDGMEGAIMMAARAALETGVGLVSLLTTAGARAVIAGKIPELMTISLPGTASREEPLPQGEELVKYKWTISGSVTALLRNGRGYRAAVLGPGLGRGPLPAMVFDAFIEGVSGSGVENILIDGDGLFHLGEYLGKNRPLPGNAFVITPHFGEASALSGASVEAIKGCRIKAAAETARATGMVTLLKGPSSITTDGTRTLVNTTGNPAMAAAGSGDVLSGIIGALLLRQMDILDAAGLGAFLHGRAGDIAVERQEGVPVLKATDIIRNIRRALKELMV